MGKRRRHGESFERHSAFPLVSVAFMVALSLVVRATATDESMAGIFYALAGRRSAPLFAAFERFGYAFYNGELAVQGAVWER